MPKGMSKSSYYSESTPWNKSTPQSVTDRGSMYGGGAGGSMKSAHGPHGAKAKMPGHGKKSTGSHGGSHNSGHLQGPSY